MFSKGLIPELTPQKRQHLRTLQAALCGFRCFKIFQTMRVWAAIWSFGMRTIVRLDNNMNGEFLEIFWILSVLYIINGSMTITTT